MNERTEPQLISNLNDIPPCKCGSARVMTNYDCDKLLRYVFCDACKFSTVGWQTIGAAIKEWRGLVRK